LTNTISTSNGVPLNCRQLFLDWDGTCPLCKRNVFPEEVQIAHDVDPRRGGAHTLENCLLLCKWCHRRKGWLSMKQILAEQVDYNGAEQPAPSGVGYHQAEKYVNFVGRWIDCHDGFQIWKIG
jgi:hypothetical protein